MRAGNLHTVCESARCPNIGERLSKKTATFMILGDICTRNCGFCAIKVGRPLELDADEPRRVAAAAKEMRLKHVVVTSVARDELPDEGSSQFAETIRALRDAIPGVIVEVLTPDFKGKRWCIRRVVDAFPDIYNHNIETVERLLTCRATTGALRPNPRSSSHSQEDGFAYPYEIRNHAGTRRDARRGRADTSRPA